MAIQKARTTKKRSYAASGCSSTVAMADMPPHGPGGANHIPPPPPVPPGVYFSPTRDECLGFLNRWIAGDKEMADARGYIFGANVYGESPDALRQRHSPASIRGRGDHTWWFLSETRFQSKIVGGGASKRADRRIETGGCWRLEQGKERLKQGKERMEQGEERMEQGEEEGADLEEANGVKNCFGFYVGPKRGDRTPWLMQEFTSANDDGAGKLGVPALYRVYVTPRATDDQLKRIFGEEHVKKGADKKKLPARAMVPPEYFDGIAKLLPEGSVRGVAQEHRQAPVGLLDCYGHQQGQYLGEHHQQQELLSKRSVRGVVQAPSPSPPADYHGQQGQYVGQYEQQQQGQYLGHIQQQQQHHGQYEHEQQQGQYHGQYEQQHGPFSMVAPPASPGLLGEFTAEAPSDNLSMPMAEFMEMFSGQPVEMVNDYEILEMTSGEPNWGSLGDTVDDYELDCFSN